MVHTKPIFQYLDYNFVEYNINTACVFLNMSFHFCPFKYFWGILVLKNENFLNFVIFSKKKDNT